MREPAGWNEWRKVGEMIGIDGMELISIANDRNNQVAHGSED
jgi:hypothetical protein